MLDFNFRWGQILVGLVLFITVMIYHRRETCIYTEGHQLYERLTTAPLTDKVKHCTLSCHLALSCSATESLAVGVAKEALDLVGVGESDLRDIRADLAGIDFAQSGEAETTEDCMSLCIASPL